MGAKDCERKMTHNELLAKLMVIDAGESEQTRLSKTTQALRTVVELHTAGNGESARCESCWLGFPCPTIEAIEKELG
ncbi:hypothetical protein UFOVP1648_15 [uncultured Caudovirales phage]|uniref:Uncharacterized protein n=1 Tax=uncultured Caudovirales phage TaxID=2100421 RepID=A0A6J5T383_9CAUD|nr:hypothetical protein UFOVP1648_15 [uncultured Caudovirales phage]